MDSGSVTNWLLFKYTCSSIVKSPKLVGKLVSWLSSNSKYFNDLSCPIEFGNEVRRFVERFNRTRLVKLPIPSGKVLI